jgi:alcohol dehydrogenase class IV
MDTDTPSVRFDYDSPVLHNGAGCVDSLGNELQRIECDQALIVSGQTVGETDAIIDPISRGLGDRLAGIFAETTPEKRLSTAVDAARRIRDDDIDAVVALGGGSSLDVATVACAIAVSELAESEIASQFESTGMVPVPGESVPGLVAIPTTLAGAEQSFLAGITASPAGGLIESEQSGGIGHPSLMPDAVFYDADLVRATPRSVLTGSAMNGFDKGIETLYAHRRAPVTDATAMRGLSLLNEALPSLAGEREAWELDEILTGTMLVQYGISRPQGTTLSLIHAFGHGLTAHTDIQQGIAHAIVAPHALSYLFANVDGRRQLLADALGVETADLSPEEIATAVVSTVRDLGDAMDLPSRLRDVEGVERELFPAIAETTAGDHLLANEKSDLEPSVAELEAVLENAW